MSRKKGTKNKPKEETTPVDPIAEPTKEPEVKEPTPSAPPIVNEPPKRGILLIALGNPQYGCMAANLAASIRFGDRDVNIHLVHNESSITHLSEQHRTLFTSMSVCQMEHYLKNGKEVYLKAKTCIYDLSPFDETIFMDVDLVFCDGRKKASNIFEELKDVDWTMQNRGFADLSKDELKKDFCQWCDINEVKRVYNTTGRFYHLASEFIYFKRTPENKAYFELVKTIFDAPLIEHLTFNGDMPDEFAYDIASAITGKYPHKDNYVLIYWFAVDKKKIEPNEIIKDFYGLSIGGAGVPSWILTGSNSEPDGFYDRVANFCMKAMGLKEGFKIFPKSQWNKLRKAV